MTDAEYLELAEALLRQIEAQCDAINDAGVVDIDNARNGGVVTLAFESGAQIVINLQKPLHEIWLAARTGGSHYRWTDGAWRDTRSGEDFYARLTHEALGWAELVLLAPASPAVLRVFQNGAALALLQKADRPVLVVPARLPGEPPEDALAAWIQTLPSGSRVKIALAKNKLTVIQKRDHNFASTLRDKLLWGADQR